MDESLSCGKGEQADVLVTIPSAHNEMFATESEPFDGDAPSHVVVADHISEGEHVLSTLNVEQTDSVQEENIACATSDSPFPSI